MKYTSPLGEMLIVSDEESVIGIYFVDQRYFKYHITSPITMKKNQIGAQAIEWLKRYFRGEQPDHNILKLNPIGSPFQKDVWQELLKIPYGKTTTYGTIAKTLAMKYKIDKMAPRAIGFAIGHNPLTIVIPCHRVIASDGKLTGYASGLERKRWLLAFEKEHI